MKKNLITVIILALVVVNLVLTAVLTFSIVPATKNANNLIAKVAAAIDLELSSGSTTGLSSVPMEDIVTYDVATSDDKMTINLKNSGNEKDHFVMLSITLSLNKKNEGYKEYGESMDNKKNLIKNEINNIISSHTKEEIQNNTQEIQEEIVDNLQALFGSDFIIGVSFGDIVIQ